MKFDFSAIREGKTTYAEMVHDVTYTQLRSDTNELFDTIQSIISPATDAMVTFVPRDSQATETDEQGWTLGHIAAHMTATLEEGAATAVTLARGVAVEGRLRYETPWENIQTVQQLQARLNESRRMCNAFLDAWPDVPDLDLTVTRIPFFGPMNAIGTYVLGLAHGQGHIEQFREVIRQAKEG